MAYSYNQSFIALNSASTATSASWYVGDFRLVSMSVESKASLGASRITVWGSNADGIGTALSAGTQGWSIVSGINLIGMGPNAMFTFDPPGYRWMRVTVEPLTQSAASYTTAILNGVSF